MRGRPWHTLQVHTLSRAHVQGTEGVDCSGKRESAYRIFAGCLDLVMDLPIGAVLRLFQRGLQDQESIEVSVLSPYFSPFFVNEE